MCVCSVKLLLFCKISYNSLLCCKPIELQNVLEARAATQRGERDTDMPIEIYDLLIKLLNTEVDLTLAYYCY